MNAPSPKLSTHTAPLPPALVVRHGQALWVSADGELEILDCMAAAARAERTPPLVCYLPLAAAWLGVPRFRAYDLLELFAFVHPARFCAPTIRGLAATLNLPAPKDMTDEATILMQAAAALLATLRQLTGNEKTRAASIAATMGQGRWPWAPLILEVLGPLPAHPSSGGMDIWADLPEWTELAAEAAPEEVPVDANETRQRLRALLGRGAEARPQQMDYAAAATGAFAPRQQADVPNVVLAEAGTGTGKTLGYIAPASLWAEKSGGAVWISTYTKNLQRQIDQELDRRYPDPAAKAARVVVRKGRENYLCLLNMEEALEGGAMRAPDAVALGLVARWASATRDGDMIGGDFPGWLVGLLGARRTLGLVDRRGECVYSACPHYKKCFVERSIRKARRAEMVIANHALVILQAARAVDATALPVRYVFDEAHHIFEAADSAFSAALSGEEGADLRRWLRGAEGGRRSRARGLRRRIGDLCENDSSSARALDDILQEATLLPQDGWLQRIESDQPDGPVERFLTELRRHIFARARPGDSGSDYGLEADTSHPSDSLKASATALGHDLAQLQKPFQALLRALAEMLDREAADLDSATRLRIETVMRSLERRRQVLQSWGAMLEGLGTTTETFVDWCQLDRSDGKIRDIGLHRHWIDPTSPFAELVLKPSHGALITSATLCDHLLEGEESAGWRAAEIRTGAQHLIMPPARLRVSSPFDYGARTRIFVVTDVQRDNVAQVSAAYRELFLAAGGGALGLFTAIWRLRAVHKQLAAPLESAGLTLLAQHVDPIDTPSLVDIFRAETDACLLGTDAMRDGIDVPGRALRLIVFDRVPWPRPDILHRARRKKFGGKDFDDMLVRLKLQQAFGRLLRRANDAGVFVMLDSMLPSRLAAAFPTAVEIERCGLADAIAATRAFLKDTKS